ncbi:SAM-dependent chlorinase/fluorinase [Thermoleptolyngbya sp. C42_A2020_037]|uniref:SAM hydrolase/SAM-dependent halogenase family protein n=1 Tax=Thermoleptolyngbya sp. C42_A2020_037 TaxID=2747799 RepID=UPI001A02E30B|nr:SAM-dependent chlorinase/fluorinase [Thermoleptolyngbya sp. C42_A2020_037]MBF2084802.1 SAM-dependent chlorinase/fluorinase [Thermoleptolyngbya sp. C42_A2020_037]
MGILTLLTDFGLTDTYVGVMKGAIAQINPTLTVIDLTHQIPPQDIAAARFHLMTAYPYFPAGTVHVAVVDPGVGGQRRAIALQLSDGYLVGPDNGLFGGVLEHRPVLAAVELTNSAYWRTPSPSATFHGRDVFAPVGAHLASGVALAELGRAIAPDSLIQLDLPPWNREGQVLTGHIQAIDHFGNAITTIPGSAVSGCTWNLRVGVGASPAEQYGLIPSGKTYVDSNPGALLALIGSHGYVEIACNQGNAQQQLGLAVGDSVRLDLG